MNVDYNIDNQPDVYEGEILLKCFFSTIQRILPWVLL